MYTTLPGADWDSHRFRRGRRDWRPWRREKLALGETPNIAARIQGKAKPNKVFISATTYHLVEGLFECENRGQPELKGVATPLTLYRARKESDAHSRFEVVVRKGLTPLIGREPEFGLLRERWERVKDGPGRWCCSVASRALANRG